MIERRGERCTHSFAPNPALPTDQPLRGSWRNRCLLHLRQMQQTWRLIPNEQNVGIIIIPLSCSNRMVSYHELPY